MADHGGFDPQYAQRVTHALRVPNSRSEGVHREPRYWLPSNGNKPIEESGKPAEESTGQPGPTTVVRVADRGITLVGDVTPLWMGPGYARWLGTRLIEAAALYEARLTAEGSTES